VKKLQTRHEGPMVLPRAFSLLRLLAAEAMGLNLSEISQRLSVPKSSLSATLKSLTEQNILVRQGTLYHLGPEAYSLASVILAGRSLRQIARPFLEKTMEESGETVILGELSSDGMHAIYVDLVDSPKSVRFSVAVGTRRPLYSSSCGRLLLAFLPEKDQFAYLDSVELEKKTEVTTTSKPGIVKILADIRNTGVSETFGEHSPDVSGFSAPIYNSDEDVIAALTIAVPISRGQREKDLFTRQVITAAAGISKTLGYKPTDN